MKYTIAGSLVALTMAAAVVPAEAVVVRIGPGGVGVRAGVGPRVYRRPFVRRGVIAPRVFVRPRVRRPVVIVR